MGALQVGRVFPELRATVQYLWENRRLWTELYMADIAADTFKTQAEKDADRVCTTKYNFEYSTSISLSIFAHLPCVSTGLTQKLLP